MNLNALNSKKYFVFLTSLVLYLLCYACFEMPYLNFLYSANLDSLYSSNSLDLVDWITLFLKKNSFSIYIFFILKIIFLVLMLSDKFRRLSAIIVICLNLIFLNLNNHTSPELKYINLLLLIIAFYPKNFNLINNKNLNFKFSLIFINSIWFIFGLSYFLSGYFKFMSIEWFSGSFLNSFARSNHNFNEAFNFILNFPWLLKFCTYAGMLSEITALPLSLFAKTRFIALINVTLIQIGLLFIADINQITFGMLIFHFFMYLTISDSKN